MNIAPPRQNTDEAFLSYVWKTLTQEEEIRVGVVELVAPKAEEENQDEVKPTQRKQPAPPPATHAIRVLDAEETKLGRERLMEIYGVNLRMSVTPEVALIGLTGSHINVSPRYTTCRWLRVSLNSLLHRTNLLHRWCIALFS